MAYHHFRKKTPHSKSHFLQVNTRCGSKKGARCHLLSDHNSANEMPSGLKRLCTQLQVTQPQATMAIQGPPLLLNFPESRCNLDLGGLFCFPLSTQRPRLITYCIIPKYKPNSTIQTHIFFSENYMKLAKPFYFTYTLQNFICILFSYFQFVL